MHYWQIRKYPSLEKGKKPQKKIRTWTSMVDIGNFYYGSLFTEEEYLEIEDKYVEAVNSYLKFLGIDRLELIFLGSDQKTFIEHSQKYPKCYTEEIIEFYYELHGDAFVAGDCIEHAVRLSLREDVSCQMRKDQLLFVNCTYDLYMDIGSNQEDREVIEKIRQSGLYADLWEPEYQTNLWEPPTE